MSVASCGGCGGSIAKKESYNYKAQRQGEESSRAQMRRGETAEEGKGMRDVEGFEHEAKFNLSLIVRMMHEAFSHNRVASRRVTIRHVPPFTLA